MSIVSRELKHVRLQANKTVKVQECLTDHLGRVYRHSYVAESEAAAVTAMNARDMSNQMKHAEKVDLLDFIRADSGDISTYSNVEMSDFEVMDFVVSKFKRTELGEDADFCVGCSDWISKLTPKQIKDSSGLSTILSLAVQNRASDIETNVASGYRSDKRNTGGN